VTGRKPLIISQEESILSKSSGNSDQGLQGKDLIQEDGEGEGDSEKIQSMVGGTERGKLGGIDLIKDFFSMIKGVMVNTIGVEMVVINLTGDLEIIAGILVDQELMILEERRKSRWMKRLKMELMSEVISKKKL